MKETAFSIGTSVIQGTMPVEGAKNAVLVIMASLIAAPGKSRLINVPVLEDVYQMIGLLQSLGAVVYFNTQEGILDVDTTQIDSFVVSPDIMAKMRASILVMGPLLARFGRACVGFPGGDEIGLRPIDFHLKAFARMGVAIEYQQDAVYAHTQVLQAQRFILEYPSVGATENIMMAAALTKGTTVIINAALEPEVFDLIAVLTKMGARISTQAPATLVIEGVAQLYPIEHAIIGDRLEAGTLLLAAAVTGGSVTVPNIQAGIMDVFLEKIHDMGHSVAIHGEYGVTVTATSSPQAVSFKTMPYPGFPTDLQAPMTVALALASGVSVVHETVFDNRLVHMRELHKMGALSAVIGTCATITGVKKLYGAHVVATDIRASAALVLAGLAAQGETIMTGLHHIRRGYHGIERKLALLGADIVVLTDEDMMHKSVCEQKFLIDTRA